MAVADNLYNQETQDWLESIDEVLLRSGPERVAELLRELVRIRGSAGGENPVLRQYSVHQYNSSRSADSLSR